MQVVELQESFVELLQRHSGFTLVRIAAPSRQMAQDRGQTGAHPTPLAPLEDRKLRGQRRFLWLRCLRFGLGGCCVRCCIRCYIRFCHDGRYRFSRPGSQSPVPQYRGSTTREESRNRPAGHPQ